MDSKVCKDCGERKPFDEFPTHPLMGDGHLNFCKPCVAIKSHKRHMEHRDENLQRMHNRYWSHRESDLAEKRRRYAENREYRRAAQRRARQRYYTQYRQSLIEHAEYRETHRDQRREYDLWRYDDRQAWFDAQKAGRSCIRCGETHPACLDFHHRDPESKIFNVSEGHTPGRWTIEEVAREMAKCDIICSNCHRKMHFGERRARR